MFTHTLSSTIYTYVTPIWKKTHFHDVQSVHSAYLVALTHSHHGLLTRHLGHLKPPPTFLTRHLFIDGHLLPSDLTCRKSFRRFNLIHYFCRVRIYLMRICRMRISSYSQHNVPYNPKTFISGEINNLNLICKSGLTPGQYRWFRYLTVDIGSTNHRLRTHGSSLERPVGLFLTQVYRLIPQTAFTIVIMATGCIQFVVNLKDFINSKTSLKEYRCVLFQFNCPIVRILVSTDIR